MLGQIRTEKGEFNEMANSQHDQENELFLKSLLPQTAQGTPPQTNPHLASEFHRRLIAWINEFDETLDHNHEVGVRLVSFGQICVFHLSDISYWNPSLISLIGVTNEGEPVELIQHVSQISILLMKLPRLDPNKPKQKIGFRSENNEKE